MRLMKKNYRLHSSLFRGLDDNKKEVLEDGFKSSRSFLNAMSDKLDAMLDSKIKESESTLKYDEDNWSLRQADMYGYRRAIRDVLNLFVDNKVKDKQ